MPTRKFGQRNIRKITRVGRKSLSLTIPKEFWQKLGWKEKQKVIVKMVRKRLTVQDWKR